MSGRYENTWELWQAGQIEAKRFVEILRSDEVFVAWIKRRGYYDDRGISHLIGQKENVHAT